MSELFPNSIKQNANKYTTSNQLDFYIYGHELKRLQRVLDLPMRISDNPVLKGFINEDKNQWGVQGYIPNIRTASNTVREITLSADNVTGKANASISADWFDSHYVLRTTTADNHTDIDLTALDSTHTITSHVQMGAEYASKKDKPVIDLNIEPSSIYMMDSIYNLTQSHIQYIVSDTLLTVSNFHIGTNSQFIAANGKASPYHTDSLKVQLGHINAGYIMPYVVADETIAVGGDLSGWAVIYGLFSKPMFEADVRLDSAFLNEECIGDAIARVALNREDNTIDINADVVKGTHTVAHVDGKVIPAENYWGLEIYPDSISIGFINHWTQGILDDIKGYASGYVNVFGRGKATWVLARVKAEGASLTIPYTGCRYHLTDSVFMDSTSIRFDNLTLYDDEGNAMPFKGILRHLYFKNFSFSIDAYPHHTLAINLPDKAGEWIQGKVYADGDVHINGNDDEVHLDANAKAVGKSRFRMSVAGASTADDNGFITFVNHNQVKAKQEDDEDFSHAMIERKYISHGPRTKFLLGINIDITPELLFQLVINDRTGDMLQGRGDGSLRFTYDDSSEAMRLLGTFAIQSGSFGFTVGNLVRREFTIAEGSSVTWNGNPESPDLNVTAKYRVTASLKDLFGDEINSLATTRTSVPVNTCLSLLGRLEDPTIRFSLELPQADDAIQNQVRSMINTDEMMMRQVVYLLVFGRFYTPEYVKSSGSADGLNETYSLLSSTITGQINSWLSKLTNVFTMGVNIRSEGSGQNASQEYEAQFQIQPVDRLVINGNVGYRYNDISNRPFFGDLDVEYLITPNGKLRIKAYTHTVDKYSLRQATTTQGVGFVFKHDFNWKKDQ